MAKFNNTMHYLRLSLVTDLRNPLRYLIYIMLFSFLWYATSGVSDWLLANNDKLNIFELYSFLGRTLFSKSVYLIGIAFISCGLFFFGPGAAYYLVRMSKKTWLNCQILYVVINVFIFNLLLIVLFYISSKGLVTLDSSWSKASFIANNKGALAINVSGIMLMSNISGILDYNPNFVGIISFILFSIEGITAGLLMAFFSLKKKTVYAVFIIFGGNLIDYLISNELSNTNIISIAWKKVMPFPLYDVFNSTLNNQSTSFIYSLVYTIIVMTVLIYMIKHQSLDLNFTNN